MSPLTLYIDVCRTLLQPSSTLAEASAEKWEESSRKLRKLRQLLLCKMCKTLCDDPFSTENCQHLVCKDCKTRKKSSYVGCRYCKTAVDLSVDKQTASLLRCYAKLCEILYSYYTSGQSPSRNERIRKILDIITEGLELAAKIRSKDEVTVQNGPTGETARRSRSPSIQTDDVSHVSKHNNVEQDGQTMQDGAKSENVNLKSDYSALLEEPENRARSIIQPALNEKLEEHSASNVKTEVDFSSIESAKVLEKQDTIRETNEKSPDECYANNLSALSQPHLNGDFSNHKPTKKVGRKVEQSFLHEKDVNRRPQLTSAKRKLRNNTQSNERIIKAEETKNQTLFKFKKRKVVKDNFDCMEENQGAALKNEDEVKIENGNISSTKEQNTTEPVVRNSSSNINIIDNKDSGQTHNVNLKTKLFRKNKYKCMCGASGIKFFNDMCRHGRCVCFAAKVPCVNCKCRFCSNPHKPGSDSTWPSLSQNGKLEENSESAGQNEFKIVT